MKPIPSTTNGWILGFSRDWHCTSFKRNCCLKISIIQFLNSSDEETLDKIFKEVDKDGNNELSNDEVGQLCTMFGEKHTDKAIEESIKEADTDGDGLVNVDEFKAQILSRSVWSLKKS